MYIVGQMCTKKTNNVKGWTLYKGLKKFKMGVQEGFRV